ncbi:MAG: holo-ACP synthase [Corynebacterium sp.]|nr:holo-ACP synthase [Corynebacterium sp.]
MTNSTGRVGFSRHSIGVDIVHIPSFAEQLHRPGSTFLSVFTPLEIRHANARREGGGASKSYEVVGAFAGSRAEHLAGRWAAKESFIKAWSQLLYGAPPVLDPDGVNFAEIEVSADRWGRVAFAFHGDVQRSLEESLGAINRWDVALSISHDGDYAIAQSLLTFHS